MKNNILILLSFFCALPLFAQKGSDNQFAVRGFYIDGRTEVMTVDAVKALAKDIAAKGMNTILFEYEATFPFKQHATLCNKYAYTEEEVKDMVSYCASLGIDVIPLQNCFGHSEYILRHNRYYHLREDKKEVSQVCPLKIEEATEVFKEIFAEVARLHPSKYFHIGADETYLLGDCKECSEVAAKEGKSILFVNYVNAMSKIVLDMGKIPIIWADIILKHPESIDKISKDIIFIDWNYGWNVNRFGNLKNLTDAGVQIWGATAMRSNPDNVYLTQWEKHLNNMTSFIPFARKAGYTGMIQTSWSTGGTYGFHYDAILEVINMQPIRSVYPQIAFNSLIDAFCEAVNKPEPLNGQAFIKNYAKEKYGLTPAECDIFWDYMTLTQDIIDQKGVDHTGTPVAKALDQTYEIKAKFSTLKPKSNKAEFAHYDLMLDYRINYLQFRKLEVFYESAAYDRSKAEEVATQLKEIVADADKLNKRFSKMIKGYLKPGEIDYITQFYSQKMKATYENVKAQEKL